MQLTALTGGIINMKHKSHDIQTRKTSHN